MRQQTHLVVTRDGTRISLDHYASHHHQTALIIAPGFFQSKDTKTFQQMSRALAHDRDVVAMDFRGHGRSGGRYTFSANESADLEAALQWTLQRYPSISIMGFSLGGAIAINAISRNKEAVRGLITISAPSAFEEIEFKWWTPEAIRTGMQGLDRRAGCRPGSIFLQKERPIENIRHVAPIPTLFVHGMRDVIVGVEHSHRLHHAAGEPKRLHIVEGGSHAEALFRDDPAGFLRIVTSWLASIPVS